MHNYAKIHNLSESMSGQRKSRCAGRWEKLGVTVSQYPRRPDSALAKRLKKRYERFQELYRSAHLVGEESLSLNSDHPETKACVGKW
jgi:hypothetical protein